MKESPLIYLIKQQEILYQAIWYHEDFLNDAKKRLSDIEYMLTKHIKENSK